MIVRLLSLGSGGFLSTRFAGFCFQDSVAPLAPFSPVQFDCRFKFFSLPPILDLPLHRNQMDRLKTVISFLNR
ncbi:unnamed protein product [Brassica rapa subsp. trilocularis]